MLYHASDTPNLIVLEPRASAHSAYGTPYVFALESFAQTLVFGARHDDFDFNISTVDGRLVVSECYPGALESVYAGKSCSVYAVADDGFERGKTGWSSELVCPHEVKVASETRIDDLLTALRENDEVELVEYCDEPEYKRFVANHVVDRMIRFGVLDRAPAKSDADGSDAQGAPTAACGDGPELLCYADRDERFRTHYKRLVDALKQAISGELL